MPAPIVLPCPDETGDSFARWWNTQGEWVEPPNVRRDGESGVQRVPSPGRDAPVLYSKRQIGHLYRSLRHPFGRPTVLREQDALQAFTRLGVRVPRVVYCGAQRDAGRWQALLVTEELEGFVSLEQWYDTHLGERHGSEVQQRVLIAIGETLSRYHRAHWQHGCCYPKHIFIRVEGEGETARIEIALLDLEKCRRRLRLSAAAEHDMRQLARHRGTMPDDDWRLLLTAHAAALGSPGDAQHVA